MTSSEWDDTEHDIRSAHDEPRSVIPAAVKPPLLMISVGIVIAYLVLLTDWLAGKL